MARNPKLKPRKAKKAKKKVKKAPRSVMVDGISYRVSKFLMDSPDEVVVRMIRQWKPREV